MGGANVGVFLPFRALESDRPANERTMVQLVQQLDRDEALLTCGYLNCIVSGPGINNERDRQARAYQALYDPEDNGKVMAWISEHGKTTPVVALFRGQLLELMRWVARFAPATKSNNDMFMPRDRRRAFMRAALLASELWSRRTYAGKLTGAETSDQVLDRALGAFRKGVEDAGLALHMGIALARAKALFEEHMPGRLPTFRTDFAAATGLEIDDYISCAAMLMAKVMDTPTDGRFFRLTYADQTGLRAEFQRFLQGATQDSTQLAFELWRDFDLSGFRSLRKRPVFISSSGQCTVLDPISFVDYITVSPVFKILGGSRPPKEVFAAFGGAFEDYSVSTLRRMYPDSYVLVRRLYIEVPHRKQDPAFVVDALVNDGDEIVVMEFKSAFIREDAILSSDPAAFLRDLRKRYALGDSPEDRPVGVAQLAKCVRAILLDRWTGADVAPDKVERIFPVLLVHDERMGSPGIGYYLNTLLDAELGEIAGHNAVAKLTVLTINDLELLDSSDFTLRDLLSSYTRHPNSGMMSVHNFLSSEAPFKDKLHPSATLMDTSLDLLRTLGDRLFSSMDIDETQA